MAVLVDAVVVVSVVLALAVAPRVVARRSCVGRSVRWAVSPLVGLVVVTGAVFLNQVLFTVYVLRVHGGDASFVSGYLPAGWFDLATGSPVLRSLAKGFPAPSLLEPTVLRVQALLELPFVLLAFGTALRWLDAGLYGRVMRSALLPLAALSYTAVFCVVEWDLYNPYTVDDVVIRCVSAVLTPLLMRRMAARDAAEARPLTASGLLAFLGSLGALGVLILIVYDTALLYNLGRMDDRASLALAAAGTLALCRLAAARLPARSSPGPAVMFAGHALRRWLVLFFAPALAVRYGVTFGTPMLAAAAGLAVAVAAGLYALRDTLMGLREDSEIRSPLVLLGRLGWAAGAALAVAYAVVNLGRGGSYYETVLLQAAAASMVTAIAGCALTDAAGRRRASRCCTE
ncbi:hypothetical protein [Streptomyces sp. JJ38]|uniref:hypothetical protein n=1 Tax=Streptomyces sp. JJ38 TaxID=2738128 RepID=UPI001C5A4E4A|nr:hypothetical protein [Streptomyces sp. JJ38]MBW1596657.1 hypothetical protein [Streptomyces sp. JJ38]